MSNNVVRPWRGGAPGPRNCLTDVPGLGVGDATDARARTGVTVIAPTAPAVMAGDVRGGGPGTRETDLLDPSTLVDRADALVLSGGSSYGLAAADGAAAWLGARGRGFRLTAEAGPPPSPIVPAAILYDLANGGDKNWGETPPYRGLGAKACEAAFANAEATGDSGKAALGRAGAGYGALAGAGPGGLGAASFAITDELIVGALIAVNSFGSPRMPGDRAFWAWPFEWEKEFGGVRPSSAWTGAHGLPHDTKLASAAPAGARANTTIGVVATNAPLAQAEARRVAIMAQDGLARAIRPIHGPTDGDAIFAMSTAPPGPPPAQDAARALTLTMIGAAAADCVARAVARGVYEAENAVQA